MEVSESIELQIILEYELNSQERTQKRFRSNLIRKQEMNIFVTQFSFENI